MVTETAAREKPAEAEAQPPAPTPTPVVVWIVYVLGILAAAVLLASLGFLAFGYATSRDGSFGADVSLPALVVWIVLLGVAAGTFAVRRWGRPG